MLPLNLPFVPDADYVDYIKDLGPRLYAVHFSLFDPALCDARVRLREVEPQTLIDLLGRLCGPKKYLLANGRFHLPDTYQGAGLSRLIDRMKALYDADALDGLIFADSYLLTALADAAPELAATLEAVPSVNFIIDGTSKAAALLELVDACGFQPPSKLSLDRSINRRPGALAGLSREIRRRWPQMKIELLANEGCLPHCPFRPTHEALIAAANCGMRVDTQRLNRDLACLRVLGRAPHRILASPFIRPEDLAHYAEAADLIKICGRTLGTAFLKRTVGAYVQGRFTGNLFALLDASHWMTERWELPNAELPEDFYTSLTACRHLCQDCAICRTLFERHARQKALRLPLFAPESSVKGG
jgi:hypothetical protein